MALTKEQKQKNIENLKEKMARQKAMVFVDFKGLKVKDLFELKKRLRDLDSVFQVCKKTLFNLVLKEKKIRVDVKKFEGQLGVLFAFGDEIAPLKAIYNFSKEQGNLKILGGFLENQFQGKEYLVTLAELPSQEELWARLVVSIKAPVSNFVQVLEANIKGLIYALRAINKQ